ncbi:hypothetical protein D3C73_569800 [compost metagenome]
MKERWITRALISEYAKLLGELCRIENPPKYETRLKPDRERFLAEAPVREARRNQIKEGLPHLAYVIRMFEPEWDETGVKPIRPRESNSGLPPEGIGGGAMDILRETKTPLTIAEIVSLIAEKNGYILDTVDLRQKYHTGVNNQIKTTYKSFVRRIPGTPDRFIGVDVDEH